MGDAAVATKRGEDLRVFNHGNLVRTVAEKAPALRQPCKQMGPVLEPGAADDSGRNMWRRQALQSLHEFVLAETLDETAPKGYMGLRRRYGVLISEEVGNQRQVSAAASRFG